MDHDDVGPFAVEQYCHVLLELFDELVGAGSGHNRVNRFEGQVLIGNVLVFGDVKQIVVKNVSKELFEVRLEARR